MLKINKKQNDQILSVNTKKRILLKTLFKSLVLKRIVSNNYIIEKYIKEKFNFCNNSYGSLSRNRNFCMITGRTRSIYRIFKLSRIKTREYGNKGLFIGFSKAS